MLADESDHSRLGRMTALWTSASEFSKSSAALTNMLQINQTKKKERSMHTDRAIVLSLTEVDPEDDAM